MLVLPTFCTKADITIRAPRERDTGLFVHPTPYVLPNQDLVQTNFNTKIPALQGITNTWETINCSP